MKQINRNDVQRLSEMMVQLKRELKNNKRQFPILIGAIRIDEERTIEELGLAKFMDCLETLYFNNEDYELAQGIISIVELLDNLYKLYMQHHQLLSDMENMINEKELKSVHAIRNDFSPADADEEW